jgi:large subunit ribosomal protein L22
MVKDKEDQIVEKELKQVEKGSQTPKEAEKDIAEGITKKETRKTEETEKKPEEPKEEEKEAEKKKPSEKRVSKKSAVVNGKNLQISTKHAVAICNFIKNKEVDRAIFMLLGVASKRIPVPMKGEIPHKKGIMSGRYPVKAAMQIIKLLRSLRANAIVNELELEKCKLSCIANIASRPYKRFGRGRFKRTNLTLKLVQKEDSKKK